MPLIDDLIDALEAAALANILQYTSSDTRTHFWRTVATGIAALPTGAGGTWTGSPWSDTPGYLAGFDGTGNAVAIDPGTLGGGTSDHTALSNKAWTSSGHTGTASSFATFTSGGAASTVSLSTYATASYADAAANDAFNDATDYADATFEPIIGGTRTNGHVATVVGGALTFAAPTGGSGATITHGTYASAPGTAANGDVHFVTGAPIYLSRESGAWVARTRSHGVALTLPAAAASWTAIAGASGTAALADNEGGLQVTGTGTGVSGPNLRPWVLATGGSWSSVTVGMEVPDVWENFVKFCVCLREAATGKFVIWGAMSNNGAFVLCQYGTSPTALSGTAFGHAAGGGTHLRFYRLLKNGANCEAYTSTDGVRFDLLGSVAIATVATTALDQYGFVFNFDNVVTRTAAMRVWHVALVP